MSAVWLVTQTAFRFLQRVSSAYRVAPIFLIRMAGVPFDVIQRLGTPQASVRARQLLELREKRDAASANVENFFQSREQLMSAEAYSALRIAVRARRVPTAVEGTQPAIFTDYKNAASDVAKLEDELDAVLKNELAAARAALIASSRACLPEYLLFAAESVRGLLATQLADYPDDLSALAPRNNAARKVEQSLLLYLQRIATKNDTFSNFGPSGWGNIDSLQGKIALAPEEGVAARDIFLERWTAHALAAAVNNDREIPQELSLKVPALEPRAFETLLDDVTAWPAGSARDRWLPVLQKIVDLARAFRESVDVPTRSQLMSAARDELEAIGAAREAGDRSLYSAVNPIGEECFRECRFSISEKLIDEVADDAAPWIDLWRDTYAYVASRVSATLRQILEISSPERRVMLLPEFLKACASAKLPLTGPGMVAPAHMAFLEVKAAFRERLKAHGGAGEYALTLEDCHVVRNRFEYPKFDAYTYPSADLQLAAESVEAVGRGEYEWLLAELHPPVALLHHAGYWSCPDKPALHSALAKTVDGTPNFHFGFFAADFTAHTTVHMFDALPKLTSFVAPQRANPQWRTIAPSETEVFADEETGDVGLRTVRGGEYLGSFARAWVIPLGFHPFQFALAPHTPRLRCGRVIVQRESWTVTREELSGDFSGVSRELVVAIEKLRMQKGWPSNIYIRPTEQALRRAGAEGRDKDTKPVHIDLESYLSLEIFYRWLTKAGELEVTEMFPAPGQLLWSEPDGRRTFELRTQIIPRK